jgi:large subunit ribosomal protein L35
MPTMHKMKTSKTASKRFKISATGKILRRRTRLNHLLTKKRESRKRRLRLGTQVFPGEVKQVKKLIPYLF